MPIISWLLLFLNIDISAAREGLTVGSVINVVHINKKFTIMDVTMISMPKKKSPAKCEPKTPMLAIEPATINDMWGVACLWWILAIFDGKIPSSAQANISLDTDSSIAGRSLINAIAAPKTIATPNQGGKT